MTILDQNGRPLSSPKINHGKPGRLGWTAPSREVVSGVDMRGNVQSRYDATYITRDNELHWANADNLAPNRANSHSVRRRLRARSRYEAVENNSYLKGIVLSKCNDFVGSGPEILVLDERLNESQIKTIVDRWNEYARMIKLRSLLWKLRHAKCVDGEGFAVAYTDSRVPDYIPRVNWQVVEADQCTTEQLTSNTPYQVDGIRFNRFGVPLAYYFLYFHPNDSYLWSTPMADGTKESGRWIKTKGVLHWFRQERPWQRGVPETTPALPLCAYMRRYNLAVLAAAEGAASITGIVKTTKDNYPGAGFGAVSQQGGESMETYDSFPLERGMWTVLPEDYDITQLKAEQPTDRHDMFIDSVLREIARCMEVPFNIAVGHSGGYNFASGTLDRQLYHGSLKRDREHCEDYVINKIFQAWWAEAIRIPAYLPEGLMEYVGSDPMSVPHIGWSWDMEPEHADPSKVADSIVALWQQGHISDEEIQRTRFNRSAKEHYASLQRQKDAREELEMPMPGASPIGPKKEEEPSSKSENSSVPDDSGNPNDE